jgi:hypothetical protein
MMRRKGVGKAAAVVEVMVVEEQEEEEEEETVVGYIRWRSDSVSLLSSFFTSRSTLTPKYPIQYPATPAALTYIEVLPF